MAVCVLPMGWLSGVGICQHLHRQLLLGQPPLGAVLPHGAELRKDSILQLSLDGRVRRFFEIYIDNFDGGAVCVPSAVEGRQQQRGAMKLRLGWAINKTCARQPLELIWITWLLGKRQQRKSTRSGAPRALRTRR